MENIWSTNVHYKFTITNLLKWRLSGIYINVEICTWDNIREFYKKNLVWEEFCRKKFIEK